MRMSTAPVPIAFALGVAIAVAALGERTPAGRIRQAAGIFAALVGIAIGVAWLLFPFSR